MHVIKAGQSVVNMPAGFSETLKNNNERIDINSKTSSLNIISPIPGASYFAAPLDTERKIPMKAEGSKGKIWWYLDGVYIGSSMADTAFFHDIPDGEHVISAADEDGRTAKVNVKVFTPGKRNQSDLLF